MSLLSVVLPVYNQAKTIKQILERIEAVEIDKEIIVVDDGSFDFTDKVLKDVKYKNLKVIYHTTQRGKGAALLTGLANANGDYVAIQATGLEYDPNDYIRLMQAIRDNNPDFVFGTGIEKGRKGLFLHQLGNRFLTSFLNMLFHSQLNSYLSCYKLAKRSTWQNLGLKAADSGIEAEIVCAALKKALKIREVAVSYNPGDCRGGKKNPWKERLGAVFCMLKYRFSD